MEQHIAVSVVIPCYNSETTIGMALDSVRWQTYTNFEIIVVNDGSNDRSGEIVDTYMLMHPDLAIRHIRQENGGPSKARNAGMRSAVGTYIAFLDSDDTWEPEKLELQIDYMDRNPDVALLGSNYYIQSDALTKYDRTPDIVEADFGRMLFKVFFSMPTVVVRREVIEREGFYFMEGKHYGEDLLFYAQIVRKYKGARLSRPLAKLHKFLYGQGGLTANLSNLLVHELDNLKILYRQNRNHSRKISFGLYILLVGYSFLKHFVRMYKSRKHQIAQRRERGYV